MVSAPLLTTTYSFPLLLTHASSFNIYVDESISYDEIGTQLIPQKFITAFYCLPTSSVKQLNEEYFKKLYQKHHAKKEKKSINVTDKTNVEALKVAQQYLTQALIFERPVHNLKTFLNQKTVVGLALELRTYILPIKQIITAIKKQSPDTPKIIINVIIDQTSLNATETYIKYNEELLNQIANELSDPNQQFEINYATADSKANYGIQVADMFAGAYRKEQNYQLYDHGDKLIPFVYQNQIMSQELDFDQEFLKLFGKITFTRLLQETQTLNEEFILNTPSVHPHHTTNRNSLFSFIYSFFHRKNKQPHLSSQVVEIANKNLKKLLDSTQETEIRKKALNILFILNQQLKVYAMDTTFIETLSKKVDQKHFNKTIDNIMRNIKNINIVILKGDKPNFYKTLNEFNQRIKPFI